MKQSRASRSSSPSCIWGTGKPTGAFTMITHWITANTNSWYVHQLDNIRKWREWFGWQLPQFVLKHKLTVLWTKLPDFWRVFVYFWHHVDRLGKLPSKEQQLSRTQHFILSSHAAMFVLYTQFGPCGIPLTPMIRRHNYLLSTEAKMACWIDGKYDRHYELILSIYACLVVWNNIFAIYYIQSHILNSQFNFSSQQIFISVEVQEAKFLTVLYFCPAICVTSSEVQATCICYSTYTCCW